MDILDLPGVVTQKEWRDEATRRRIFKATVIVQREESCPEPCCRGKVYRYDKRCVTFRDAPFCGYRSVIRLTIPRYECAKCGKVFYQNVPGLAKNVPGITKNRFMTLRCVEWIGRQGLAFPFATVAEQVGCSPKTVRDITCGYVYKKEISRPADLPAWLAIDEAHPTGDREYCVISDLDRSTPIDMLKDTRGKTLAGWLWQFRTSTTLRGVTMDMCPRYKRAITKLFPNALIVVDKFHVVRMANDVLDALRSGTAAGLEEDKGKQLNRDRYLFRKRAKKISPMTGMIRSDWLKKHPELEAVYWLKEKFFEIYDLPSRAAATMALDDWRAAVVHRRVDQHLKPLLTSTKNWRKEILAYFDRGPNEKKRTNALAEAINGNCKLVNKIGRGYRFPMLRAKLLFVDRERLGNASRVDPLDEMVAQAEPEIRTRLVEYAKRRDLEHPHWLRGLLLIHHQSRCQSCGGAFAQQALQLYRTNCDTHVFEYPFGFRLLCPLCLRRSYLEAALGDLSELGRDCSIP